MTRLESLGLVVAVLAVLALVIDVYMSPDRRRARRHRRNRLELRDSLLNRRRRT